MIIHTYLLTIPMAISGYGNSKLMLHFCFPFYVLGRFQWLFKSLCVTEINGDRFFSHQSDCWTHHTPHACQASLCISWLNPNNLRCSLISLISSTLNRWFKSVCLLLLNHILPLGKLLRITVTKVKWIELNWIESNRADSGPKQLCLLQLIITSS